MTETFLPHLQLAPDHRPNVYVDNGIVVYRASTIGTCIRALVAARRNFPPADPPELFKKKFQQGIDYEPVILKALTDSGKWATYSHQQEVELVIREASSTRPKIVIRGHIDACGHRLAEESGAKPQTPVSIVEVKKMSKGEYAKWARKNWADFPRYAWQVSSYVHAKNLQYVLMVIGEQDGDSLTIHTQLFTTPPITVAMLKSKVLRVEALASSTNTDLPLCDFPNYPCPYHYLHDEPTEELVVCDDDALQNICFNYFRAKEDEKLLADKRKELRLNAIKAYRALIPLATQARVGSYKVHCRQQSRKSTNTAKLDAFLKQHNMTLEDFQTETTYDYFDVQKLNPGE